MEILALKASTIMNWTEILKAAGVDEPPGYLETLEVIAQDPYVKPSRKSHKSSKRRVKSSNERNQSPPPRLSNSKP